MAKSKMLCPFSKKLCFECPQYRGRHYYLCFNTKYRGYLGEQKNEKMHGASLRGVKIFKMPANLAHSPTWLTINTLQERNYAR
jgi:hypothetical protein